MAASILKERNFTESPTGLPRRVTALRQRISQQEFDGEVRSYPRDPPKTQPVKSRNLLKEKKT